MSNLVTGMSSLDIDVLVEEASIVSNGARSYANLRVKYEGKTYSCKRWNYSGEVPKVGTVIRILGRTDSYQGTISVIISDWVASSKSPLDFVRTTPIETNFYCELLINALGQIKSESKRRFVATILEDYKPQLLQAPAGVSMHHAYVGGLLQHTAEVLNCAVNTAVSNSSYNKVNYDLDLVRMGAILHDVGKLKAYTLENGIPVMTLEGQLYDHIVLGVMILEDYRKKLELSEDDMIWYRKLVHIILSHHGELEYGSPVKPAFPEAYIVSQADMISSKLNRMDDEMAEMTEPFQSKKSFMFGTRLYNSEIQ